MANFTTKLIEVDLGICKVQIPVSIISGTHPGKTVIITAGMDGDEYSGIQVAYELIEEFSTKQFSGKLIIIPIVNIPGFTKFQSQNPLDNLFPKNINFGNPKGKPTERLIDWVYSTYIKKANFWIDLHGGSLTELLNPFVLGFETSNKEVNALAFEILQSLPCDLLLFEKAGKISRENILASDGIGYLLFEAGLSGDRSRKWIKLHKKWVKVMMGKLEMIKMENRKRKVRKIYTRTTLYIASQSGLWFPDLVIYKIVRKGQKIGELRTLLNKPLQIFHAQSDGVFLWGKESLACQKGEILFAMCI